MSEIFEKGTMVMNEEQVDRMRENEKKDVASDLKAKKEHEDRTSRSDQRESKIDAEKDSSEVQIRELTEKLKQAEESASNFQDKLLRTLADMENLRRRTEKEKSDIRKYALEGVMKDILPVLDSFDQALEQANSKASSAENSSGSEMVSGMQLIQKQLVDFVSKNGLESIESLEQPFDPNLHQAIRREESSEIEVDTVSEQYSKGYLLNGRVIRAAVVSVKVKA